MQDLTEIGVATIMSFSLARVSATYSMRISSLRFSVPERSMIALRIWVSYNTPSSFIFMPMPRSLWVMTSPPLPSFWKSEPSPATIQTGNSSPLDLWMDMMRTTSEFSVTETAPGRSSPCSSILSTVEMNAPTPKEPEPSHLAANSQSRRIFAVRMSPFGMAPAAAR